MKITVEEIKHIIDILEAKNHPDPIGFIARGQVLTGLNNKNKNGTIGWLGVPVEVYDEYYVAPDQDDLQTVTNIALEKDLNLFNIEGFTIEEVHKFWLGSQYSKMDSATKKVNSMLDDTKVSDSETDQSIKAAINNTNELISDKIQPTDLVSQFRLELIEKLGA